MFFFYVMAIATACISACVSIFLRLRMPQRKWPECLLAVLIVLGVITIWCSIFFVGGWDGMALGMLGIHVIVGAFAGYLIETVFRLLKRQIKRR
ncbi:MULTISPECIES: YesK-like family protein [Bacillus]|uniref:Membrane component n=1 Tax=Bacillus mojavensis TaxID=72360 RepID=A0ABX6LTQ7_BACMO|nr:YesK-like family protein [Bacillus mojavensis]MEC1669718.1 YesK-like family protein [Bacillus mojavensis]MEC1679529.1 YesK-like family protein [Bacillus mojavensis]MEC1712472.1 YesK-like family protein [Bacillus mojavensis]QJC95237.1 Putative membrane component [Bacillus mojavensis]